MVPRVSVVIPIFNGKAFLPAFFESLSSALPNATQVILVDDASTEPVWETVPEFPAAQSVLRLQNEKWPPISERLANLIKGR
jgi:glycosyltransferase involved in cell wall biosynthesis